MITESKFFKLYAMGKPAGRCVRQLAEIQLSDSRQASLSVPTWAAVAMAPPQSTFVTSTHKQVSKHVNPKTKCLHTGVGQDGTML